MEVLLVGRQVAGEIANPLAQDGHLDLGRPGVALLRAVFGDERLFALGSDRHRSVPSAIDDSYRAKAAAFNPGESDQSLAVPSADDQSFIDPVETSPRAAVARRDPLPATQPSGLSPRQGN